MKKSVKITLIVLISVVGVALCSWFIGKLIYRLVNTKHEIRYTTGKIIDKDRYTTITYIPQQVGKSTVMTPRYTTNYRTTVCIDNSDITFTDTTRTTYERYENGAEVRVEISDNYLDGEWISTYYNVRPTEIK